MHGEIKLISKPLKPYTGTLICAAYMNDLSELSEESHYVIEDENGKREQMYARNDEACHTKLVKKWMARYSQSK
jgi:hypothetical protein